MAKRSLEITPVEPSFGTAEERPLACVKGTEDTGPSSGWQVRPPSSMQDILD